MKWYRFDIYTYMLELTLNLIDWDKVKTLIGGNNNFIKYLPIEFDLGSADYSKKKQVLIL